MSPDSLKEITRVLYETLVALVWMLLIVVACVLPVGWVVKVPLIIFIFVVGFVSLGIDAWKGQP